MFKALKPGGLYGVVDHHALQGTGLKHCEDLHRIDAETVIEQVTAAGFVFEAESDCLANPEDTHDWFIWKERGTYSDTTDRFVFRFRKPVPVEERGSSE